MLEKSLTDTDKRQLLHEIKSHYQALWAKDIFSGPWSIIHGVPHSESVIKVLDRLLEAYMTTRYRLNQAEILVLLGSAWLHDVGYLPQEKETAYDFDLMQANHPIRGYEYVMDHLSACGGAHWGPLIALCIRGHREVPVKKGEYDDTAVKSERVRLQFLTALLRLADELDLGEERAPKPFHSQLKAYYDKLPDYTLLHWIRHFYTEGIELRQVVGRYGVTLQIRIHAYIPSEEYKDYVVNPWIIEPIKAAVLDTYQAVTTEGLTLDTVIDSYITIVSMKEPIPGIVFSHFQKQVLDRESLRSLIRYDFRRSIKFLGKIGQKDPIFKSDIVRAKNSLGYTLINNSDDKRWVSGNGIFLNVTTDFLEIRPRQLIDRDMMTERTGFEMHVTRGGKASKARVKYIGMASLSVFPERSTVTALVEELERFKPFGKKIFGFYEIKGNMRLKTMSCRYAYLEPIQPKEAVRFDFSWYSTFLPWDVVSVTLRHPTKGIEVSFENFPNTYMFSTTATLLKEFDAMGGKIREPMFSVLYGDIARKFVDSSLLAPGTQVVVQWRDTTQRGQGSLDSEVS